MINKNLDSSALCRNWAPRAMVNRNGLKEKDCQRNLCFIIMMMIINLFQQWVYHMYEAGKKRNLYVECNTFQWFLTENKTKLLITYFLELIKFTRKINHKHFALWYKHLIIKLSHHYIKRKPVNGHNIKP